METRRNESWGLTSFISFLTNWALLAWQGTQAGLYKIPVKPGLLRLATGIWSLVFLTHYNELLFQWYTAIAGCYLCFLLSSSNIKYAFLRCGFICYLLIWIDSYSGSLREENCHLCGHVQHHLRFSRLKRSTLNFTWKWGGSWCGS